jgi:general secretion pathway protein I
MKASSSNLNSIGYLEQKMIANWVASNRLVELSLEKKWPPENNKKGSVEMGDREWFWLQKVQKTEDEAMRAITIEVRLNDSDENNVASLLTFVSKRSDL